MPFLGGPHADFGKYLRKYRKWDNKRPWALKIQTDSKPHENDVKIRRPSGALIVRTGPWEQLAPGGAPILRRPPIVRRPLNVRNTHFHMFTYVQSNWRGKVMLCTLQTYKHDHITVPKCAENWKVQQSVPRYTGSIEQNKVLHSQWFHLKFRVFLHSLF